MENTIGYNEMVSILQKKGYTKKEIKKMLESGKIKPFVKNAETGNYSRYRVIKINNDGTIDGVFEN